MTPEQIGAVAALVGRPYRPGGRGPEAYDCYGLVRHVRSLLLGDQMSDVPTATATTRAAARAMLTSPERQRWAEKSLPEHCDLVLMGNVSGRDYHLGIFLVPSSTGIVLHADEPCGVVSNDLASLLAIGYNSCRFFGLAAT